MQRTTTTRGPLLGHAAAKMLLRAAVDGSDDGAVKELAATSPPVGTSIELESSNRLEYFVGRPGEFQRDLRAAGVRCRIK
jgi:hypothetical protein